MATITTETGTCVCCGAQDNELLPCVCHAYPEWQANEHGDLKCGYHKAELYLRPERTTIALGVKPLESNDRWRNFR